MWWWLAYSFLLVGACFPSSESIIGGIDAIPHSLPFVVSLQDKRFANSHYCAGTLLNTNHVLTTGNCCQKVDPPNIQVALGAHSLVSHDYEQLSGVAYVVKHPDYDPITLLNDICILRLEKYVILNEVVDGAKLPNPGLDFPSGKGIITGWGATGVDSPPADTLKVLKVDIVANDDCEAIFGDYFDAKKMMCGKSKNGRGFCRGDGGGPLICEDLYECGIISWNIKCDQGNHPAVFTRVGYYLRWIQEVVYKSTI